MTIRGAVLDVDGTVVRGDDPIPGAREGLAALDDAGVARLFVSNNPTKVPAACADRLGRAGFDVAPDEVVTSGTTTVAYLDEHHPDDRLFVVGEAGLRSQLSAAGLSVTDDPDDAEVVVASIDREFTYDRLREAFRALDGDVPLVGTDPDAVIPAAAGDVPLVGTDPDAVIPAAAGDVPGSGAIVSAVAAVAERDPDAVLGKPSPTAQRLVRERLGLPPESCLVVGDRLDTDIALGERAGMETALVLTGVTDGADLAAGVTPDHVLDTLADLADLLPGG